MKVTLVSYSDVAGGAARAAHRLHRCLLDHGVASGMRVASKGTDEFRVTAPRGKVRKVLGLVRSRLGQWPNKLQHTTNPIEHSLAMLPSRLADEFNADDADAVHLHWIGGDMMSIEDVGRIRKPVVWTLHDSWAFCGAEHHPDGLDDRRFVLGYTPQSRLAAHHGVDLDRWTWQRKARAWTRPFVVVTPSQWLANCARQSKLMHDWPIQVIPNPLPTAVFKPWPKRLCREILGLPADPPLVLFGAVGGTNSAIKGWSLLADALHRLAAVRPDCRAVVFGQSEPAHAPDVGMPVHYMGRLQDESALALLYSAVDVVVVPSRIENLPQVGTEAQACGTPVVGFDCSGMPDVVDHHHTGYLAKAYEAADLSEGIRWVLDDPARHAQLSANARTQAVAKWSPEIIGPRYLAAYAQAIEASRALA